jgi:repressor LexA
MMHLHVVLESYGTTAFGINACSKHGGRQAELLLLSPSLISTFALILLERSDDTPYGVMDVSVATHRLLTKSQVVVLEFIRSEFQRHNRAPTIREIAGYLGHNTPSSAQLHVRNLVTAGYLERGQGHRALSLTEVVPKGLQLLGIVAAGPPIQVCEQDERIEIGGQYNDETHFALKVQGDSMIDDCIASGDYVVVRKQGTCENGDLVVARVDGEVTLKRFYREKKRVRLQPANSSMKPIYCREVEIEGVVVGVHRVMG